MLQLTAAAAVIDGTLRLDAVRAFAQDLQRPAFRIAFFDFFDENLSLFAGQCIRYEYRKVLETAYALCAAAKAVDFYFVFLALLDRDFIFHFSSFFMH